MKKNQMWLVIISICCALGACSTEQMYSAAASHQCQRDATQNPQVSSASCINERSIDGKTYQEYERARKE